MEVQLRRLDDSLRQVPVGWEQQEHHETRLQDAEPAPRRGLIDTCIPAELG
jgi:hypothetical protein